MGYIITARVYTDVEENLGGNVEDVDARILSKRDGEITFDVRGDFKNYKTLTLGLCNSLVSAGFVSFEIGHSY